MAIIHMGWLEKGVENPRFIDGAFTPFQWLNDQAVSEGNHEIVLREQNRVAMFLYTTHHGLCIRDREMNGRDDSDFYMLVWDEEAQAPFEICFASTRGWSYPCYGSSPDATPEVMAAYNAWCERQRQAQQTRAALRFRLDTVKDCLHLVHKGATCRVARGRKVPVGTEGKVIGLSERPDYMGKAMETWALLDTGTGFTPVLAKHLDIIRRSPEALQAAFDAAC